MLHPDLCQTYYPSFNSLLVLPVSLNGTTNWTDRSPHVYLSTCYEIISILHCMETTLIESFCIDYSWFFLQLHSLHYCKRV